MVADGLGGGMAGELASTMLCEEIADAVAACGTEMPALRMDSIQKTILRVNTDILSFANKRNYSMMGTTLALLLFNPWIPDKAEFCHVGDSRIYRIRNHGIEQLTQDHTVGMELLRKDKTADPEKLTNHLSSRLSHLLTKAVGTSNVLEPEWNSVHIESMDKYLICSDGITTMLPDSEIKEYMDNASSPEEALNLLEEKTLEAGAKDNYTAIAIFLGASLPDKDIPSQEEAAENEYIIQTIGVLNHASNL